MNYRSLTDNDNEIIAKFHLSSLKDSMLTHFGYDIVVRYYHFISSSKDDVLFSNKIKNSINGACVLSMNSASLMKRFLKSNIFPVFYAVIKHIILSSSTKRKRITGFLFNRNDLPIELSNLPEVVQIFIDPSFRKSGCGTNLLSQTEAYLLNKNIDQYFIKTDSNNKNKAKLFYEKNNFIELRKITSGGKSYTYYVKSI